MVLILGCVRPSRQAGTFVYDENGKSTTPCRCREYSFTCKILFLFYVLFNSSNHDILYYHLVLGTSPNSSSFQLRSPITYDTFAADTSFFHRIAFDIARDFIPLEA